jgi:hypothetical protein
MNRKLTVKLDTSIIEQAKKFAKGNNTSLSELIEMYLVKLVEPNDTHEVTPFVKSLSGRVGLHKNFDYKKEYNKHLANKFDS